MEFCQVNHQAREDRLAGIVRGSGKSAWQIKTDFRILLTNVDCSTQAQHIVEGAFHQTHSAGNSGTDNIAARLGITASVWNETVVMGF